MWTYEKKLQYPVKIACPNPALAKAIISQFGGPDGELAASMRYLSQRYTMPYKEGIATLTDVGTEELSHMEMICAIVHQLTRNLTPEEIKRHGFAEYYVDHTAALWPQAAGGTPFSATFFQSKGDPITDLHENMAAEQKARTTYDNIIRLTDDPDVLEPIRFLRERELVHFQRFGETLRIVQDRLDCKNYYAFNPAFDIGKKHTEAAEYRREYRQENQRERAQQNEKECCSDYQMQKVSCDKKHPQYCGREAAYDGNTGKPLINYH